MRIKRIAAVLTVLILVIALACACGKKPKPAAQALEVSISRTDFIPSTNFIEVYSQHPERFTSKVAASFEMDSAAGESFFSAPEEWLAYEIVLGVNNTSDHPVTLFGLNVAENGKNGVYIQTQLEDGVTLSAGASGSISVTVLCSDGNLSDAQAKALADKYTLCAEYYIGTGSADIPAETYTAEIK